ncbi:DNA mismatch repair protein MutS [Paucihalobacter ruber]|uniref:DNA mismatch repair protein MutS n=1 Tax=Paucihalobacter ruber TaxID=2567861 RepID=A0A506PLP8_9FLAO|nr:DNA mismatch repair protein MutS [Paucihalobacter ruber]TPV34796.1 DNA mismatch repair protein MutS [Paucihalobacter ruber]
MRTPISTYRQLLKSHSASYQNIKRQINLLSAVRLVWFLAVVVSLYLTFNQTYVFSTIGVLGLIVFLWLLSKHSNLKHRKDYLSALITINQNEIEIANGNYHHQPNGLAFQEEQHAFSLDIDLFGRASFFQYINRTTTQDGQEFLANLLLSNNIEDIPKKQEGIKELSEMTYWRQDYSANAKIIESESHSDEILKWLSHHGSTFSKTHRTLAVIFSMASLAIFSLVIFKALSLIYLGYWLLFGLFVSGIFIKKVNVLSYQSSKAKQLFKSYAVLLGTIESTNFKSEWLLEHQKHIQNQNQKASGLVKQFSQLIDRLDNRNNLIWAIVANGFFLVDIWQSFLIEQWIVKHKANISQWFTTVAFFDAYNSFGTYAFNHPEFVFPDINSNDNNIKAMELGHPLIKADKRVCSDVTIQSQQFFIVTGANMAGKSTFLRTVGLCIVSANLGLPVCAKNAGYKPIKLITSMRTTDSLTDDSSYFFSELKRLQYIVNQLQNEPYFVILDEILKGTNSTDKAIGSKKFIERLVKSKATGIIATHDLSLCDIEATQTAVKNYFFDAEIKNNELYFDYKLKQGICENMNASFLLKKMGIVE